MIKYTDSPDATPSLLQTLGNEPGRMAMTSSRAPKPSYAQLPEGPEPYPTILDYLAGRFAKVPRAVWERRLAAGAITDDRDGAVDLATPYRPRLRLKYYREVAAEPALPFTETIVFQDNEILVADKPHFMPVIPSGPYVNECLVYRLRRRLANEALVPVNRLDRETAGLVLFSVNPATRAKYYRLFQRRRVKKVYEAWARLPATGADVGQTWTVETRIEKSTPWFLSANVPGEPNSRTVIRLVERRGDCGRFEAEPVTGRNHQVRLHLAHIGCGIVNDGLYPVLSPGPKTDYERPLQLLARELAFQDPVTGEERVFSSGLTLTG